MGADARLFLFDFGIYQKVVVPAFWRLMRDGAMEDWLGKLLLAHEEELDPRWNVLPSTGFVPIGFSEFCTYLDHEFAVTQAFSKTGDDYDGSWRARACRHPVCPVRDSCPFHLAQGDEPNPIVDNWMRWLAMAVADRSMVASHLSALQLPEYERSFAAMEAFKRRRNLLESRVGVLSSLGSYTSTRVPCLRN